ncbi:hypothetical protein Tco_0574194 [Tanacetum coccineum]
MITPLTPVMSRTRIFIPFIILSDSEDEDTTLPVVSAPLSPDYVSASHDYLPDSNSYSKPVEDDSPNEDLTKTDESLQTQTTLTPVIQPPPTRPLPTILAIVLRPRQEILLPPSATLPSSPPPLLLRSTSRKISKSSSPPLPRVSPPVAVSLPAPAVVALASADHETLRAVAAEQQAIDLQDSQKTNILKITKLRSRVEDVETHLERSHIRQTGDRVRLWRVEMSGQVVEALHARAEAAEQRAKALQASLRATQIDIADLRESRRAKRLEMTELRT